MRISMLGELSSGKTSYLGALWACVRTAGSGAPVHLRDGLLPASSTYLNECEHSLLGGDPVERTKRDHGERVELDLVIDGTDVAVTHLDVAGETFEGLLEQRIAAPSLISELASSDAVMLFVHPRRVRESHTIVQARREMAALGHASVPEPQADGDAGEDEVRVWKHTATAVHLVDLLQLVSEHRAAPGPLQVAIVVSAWDVMGNRSDWGSGIKPSHWVTSHLPLLDQYLRANPGQIDFQIFGVSAQGCDFGDDEAVEAIVGKPYHQRTVVVTDSGWSSDIAEPLRWFAHAAAVLPA